MYTEYEYVIVHKVEIFELNRFGQKWKTQRLYFRFFDSQDIWDIGISNKIDISSFRKGNKVKIQIEFYRCGNGAQQIRFKVTDVLKCS